MNKFIVSLVSVLLTGAALAAPANLPDRVSTLQSNADLSTQARMEISRYHHDADRLNEALFDNVMHPSQVNVLMFVRLLSDFSKKQLDGLSRLYTTNASTLLLNSNGKARHDVHPSVQTLTNELHEIIKFDDVTLQRAQDIMRSAQYQDRIASFKGEGTTPASRLSLDSTKQTAAFVDEMGERYISQLKHKLENDQVYLFLLTERTAQPHVETALYHTMVLSQLEHIVLLLKKNLSKQMSSFTPPTLQLDGAGLIGLREVKNTTQRTKLLKPLDTITHSVEQGADMSVASGQ